MGSFLGTSTSRRGPIAYHYVKLDQDTEPALRGAAPAGDIASICRLVACGVQADAEDLEHRFEISEQLA